MELFIVPSPQSILTETELLLALKYIYIVVFAANPFSSGINTVGVESAASTLQRTRPPLVMAFTSSRVLRQEKVYLSEFSPLKVGIVGKFSRGSSEVL